MKMFRHPGHFRETEDNSDDKEFTPCIVCGAEWFPMWPPTMERKHPADCIYAQDQFHAEGCSSPRDHTGPCVVTRGPGV